MALKVLALVENNIGTKLLVSTRLNALGYQVTVLSAAEAFRKRIEAEAFDWLILDEAAARSARRRLLEHVARHREGARIAWLGRPPRGSPVPIEAVFVKPLHYSQIVRFFSEWPARDPRLAGSSSRGPGTPLSASAGPKRCCLPGGEEGRKTLGRSGSW